MSTTIMCGLFVVAFTFNNDKFTLLWTDNKPIAIILDIVTIVSGTQWLKHQRLFIKGKQNLKT